MSLSDAASLLWQPFLVAACLVAIHTYFGVQVLARNIVFVDLALAQIAALGATVAFMLGHPAQGTAAYTYSLAFTLFAAVLLSFTRSWAGRIPQEALIGVIYVVAAAVAFLLVDKAPQGTEHIKQILTGNILTVGANDLALIVPLYTVIGAVHITLRRVLSSPGVGASGWWWDFVFYASFGLVVTSSVALAGVLLVFAMLIVPAAIGMLYVERRLHQLLLGWGVGLLACAAGLAVSYTWDLPTGATMVCAFGAALALAGIARPFRDGGRHAWRKLASSLRVIAALGLSLSALWMAISPTADQPLLDLAESLVPGLRALYMTGPERTIYQDANDHAQRYRLEAEHLNARETQSRWQGQQLEDIEVRKISSFLQSYAEMRKGEEFVMGEVRARARQRARWGIAAGFLLLGLLLAPWHRRRRQSRNDSGELPGDPTR